MVGEGFSGHCAGLTYLLHCRRKTLQTNNAGGRKESFSLEWRWAAPNNVFTNVSPLPLSRHVSQQQSMEYTSNLRHVQHTTEFGEKERYWPLGDQVSFVLL